MLSSSPNRRQKKEAAKQAKQAQETNITINLVKNEKGLYELDNEKYQPLKNGFKQKMHPSNNHTSISISNSPQKKSLDSK